MGYMTTCSLQEGILIALGGEEEEEGQVQSNGTDSFPQGSQELF